MYGMSARHEGAPGWGTDGVDIVVLENDSAVGQAVNVGGGDLVGPVEAHVVPALDDLKVFLRRKSLRSHEVVSHYEDDVRRFAEDNLDVHQIEEKRNVKNVYPTNQSHFSELISLDHLLPD